MSDLISRQAAIDAIQKLNIPEDMCVFEIISHIEVEIATLPTVQQKRGKWLPDNRCGGGYWVCSSCKNPTEAFAADVLYKYCPFCGAKMEG